MDLEEEDTLDKFAEEQTFHKLSSFCLQFIDKIFSPLIFYGLEKTFLKNLSKQRYLVLKPS